MPELSISTDKVEFLIVKAREFDVKEGVVDPDSGSNGADDDMIDVLENDGRDPVVREISGFINALSDDEQIDLVTLVRLGRGDGSIDKWNELPEATTAERHNILSRRAPPSGVDLTFASLLAADRQSECQTQNSTSNSYLVVVLRF